MISDIQNGLSAIKEFKGLRNILWALLVFGLSLVVIESVTQYFSISSLQAKTELLEALSRIESTPENKQKITLIHTDLIKETKYVYQLKENPSLYLLDIILRFIQGAYISILLFYLYFRIIRFGYKHAGEFFKKNTRLQEIALMLGSFLLSVIIWVATLLGVASVLWNKSESWWVAWIIFPITSAAVLIIMSGLIFWLRFVVPGKKSTELKNG